MKKISLIFAMAGLVWVVQPANAQVIDSSKNKVEIKKKVKRGVHGRQVTKIKMEGTGTASAISGAADGAVTGKLPKPAPVVVTPPAPEVTQPPVMVPTPAPQQNPTVIVVKQDRDEKPSTPTTTSVTTTTETKPVRATTSTSVRRTTTASHVTRRTNMSRPVYHKVYTKKPAVAASTKTTTTTTVKKTE